MLPTSENPEVIIIVIFTPFSTQLLTASNTNLAGMTIHARSIGSPISSTLLETRRASISPPLKGNTN